MTPDAITSMVDPWLRLNRQVESTALPETIPGLLWEAAENFSESTALRFFERNLQLTFRELGNDVARLCDSLTALGVRRGDHVAILCSNRIEYPVVWLALAALGAPAVPLVLKSTDREIQFFLEDSEARYLIVEDARFLECRLVPGRNAIPDAAHIVLIGDQPVGTAACRTYAALLANGRADFRPEFAPRADDLLSIQYTSGTTGLPKGAMLTHRYWMQLGIVPTLLYKDEFGHLLCEGPFYYMDAQWMLVASLFRGLRVDVAERMSISKWVERLQSCGTQTAWLTEQALRNPASPRELDCQVRMFLGEHASKDSIALARERFGVPVYEAYGSTEAGFVLSVRPDLADLPAAGTCGVPGPFRECRIVLPDGTDAPVGSPGELWVKGPGLFLGYYGRAEATREALVDGWFHTGDLFVKDNQGLFRIVGRIKDMVRRSGENISASEVEQTLMDFPGILRAAVVAVPDTDRGEEIKAYLQLAPGAAKPEVTSIVRHCKERLAPFKCPRFFAFVSDLPLTGSGKVAKKFLTIDGTDLRAGSFDILEGRQL